MPDWRYETSSSAPDSPVGYGVLDAFGLRIGTVDGWMRSPGGEVLFVVVAVRNLLRTARHALPLGYVVQFDTRRRQLHLRELTRRSLPQRCPRFEGVALPAEPELDAVLREAPHVRPEIRDMMANPGEGLRPMRPGRLTAAPEQGDGRAGPPPPPAPPPATWSRVGPALAAEPARVPNAVRPPEPAPTAPAARPSWQPLASIRPTWQRLSEFAPRDDG